MAGRRLVLHVQKSITQVSHPYSTLTEGKMFNIFFYVRHSERETYKVKPEDRSTNKIEKKQTEELENVCTTLCLCLACCPQHAAKRMLNIRIITK